MANVKVFTGADFALRLSKLATGSEQIAKKAIKAGAKVIADRVRTNLDNLPTDNFRQLQPGEKFKGIPHGQKKDLQESFGVTPIKRSRSGDWNAHIGFDDYGSVPTEKYPEGLPNQLLARAVESGSSVREKTPFIRPAVNATKQTAIDEMARVVDEEIQKLVNE